MSYKELSSQQKSRFLLLFSIYITVGVVLLSYFCITLYNEKTHINESWSHYLQDSPEDLEIAEKLSANATKVTVGTYVDNLKELNLKNSFFRLETLAWFSWEGDKELNPAANFRIYNGTIDNLVMVKELYEGGKNYQLVKFETTVTRDFNTRRFPLESHQLRYYIESLDPIQEVVFVADKENSGVNPYLAISGYKFVRSDMGVVSFKYDTTHGDPELDDFEMTSEVITALEINRLDFGMYLKCFIALVGTITWVLIALYLCAFHHVDPIGLIPGALFGTVSNIMVGASLVPDALQIGLLEYVNIWGILTIIGVTVAIININEIRNKFEEKDFAHFLAIRLFVVILLFTIIGQILLPLSAYIF